MNDMDWLNKSAEQNLDEILAMADINARLRIICGTEKQAWEVDDDTGSYSDWPLRYAAHLTEPPQVPITHPDYDREVTTKTLQQAVKKLPPNRKLHWVDNDAVLGERSWYNPARYLAGKQITGDKNYELGQDSDDKSRADIIQQILDNYEGRNALMAHYPARYYEDDEDPEAKSPAKQAGMQETLGNATEAVKGWAGDATDAVKGWASGLPAAAQGAVDSARPWVNSALNSAQGAASSVQDWAGKNPWLAAGLGGAGLGAAGLAAINRMNPDEDERDLSNSLRTGAITGAGLGLGGMALAKHLPGVLSGLGVNPKVDDLTKQIGEKAKAPYALPLLEKGLVDGTIGAGTGALNATVGYPLAGYGGLAQNAYNNPGVGSLATLAGATGAGALYGHDVLHRAVGQTNLAQGRGVTNNPDTLRDGIVRALKNTNDKGVLTDAAAKPSTLGWLWNTTMGKKTPTLTPELRKALAEFGANDAKGGPADAVLKQMLDAGTRNMPLTHNGTTIQPDVIRSLANSTGYGGRANTPLRYELATAAEGRLPKWVTQYLAKPLKPRGQPGVPLQPHLAAPNVINRALGFAKLRGARLPLTTLALLALTSQNEGQ